MVDACVKQKGCPLSDVLATWKRLLKAEVDAAGEELDEDPGEEGLLEADTALAADIPEAARAARLLGDDHRHTFDRMVQFNPAVQAGIRRWLTDMRPQLMTSYENYRTMRHLMWPEFERRGLPEALLFGIMAKESNGRVHAVSRAGAAGPMQFMPATGRRFGLGPDDSGFDSRYDPRSAAMASAAYLNERLRQLNNDLELSLAGYNGGEGRALRVHRQSGGTGFWNASVYDQFPAETRDYVPMVIAAAWIYLHPRQYGVVFPKVDAQPAQLRLTRPASIYELTVCLGNSGNRDGYMRALRNLNPRWNADSTIPAGTALNATTSGLIERTSEMLRDNSVTIQQQAASSTVSVESLQKAFANVYQTMDSIDSFKIEALNNMSQTIGTLETEVAKSRAYLERARQSDSRRGLAEGITSTPNYDLR